MGGGFAGGFPGRVEGGFPGKVEEEFVSGFVAAVSTTFFVHSSRQNPQQHPQQHPQLTS